MILWSLILKGFGKKLRGLNKLIRIFSYFSSDIAPNILQFGNSPK
jgi:hypothetical protein